MDKLSVQQARDMILNIADEIIGSKDYLTEVDAKIGDGDHGIGMETGFSKVKETLDESRYDTINDLFRAVGMAMLNSMGGASGVIFSSIFTGGVRGLEPATEIGAAAFAGIMTKSLDVIKQRGKAEPGDKTMVDAMEPACQAMIAYAETGNDFVEMLKLAEQAAHDGMEDTKNYVAKFGRSKSLMERAVGHQDAGATSVYLMFRAMRTWAERQ